MAGPLAPGSGGGIDSRSPGLLRRAAAPCQYPQRLSGASNPQPANRLAHWPSTRRPPTVTRPQNGDLV